MKKIVALPLVAALALSTMACAKKDAADNAADNAVDGNVVLNEETTSTDNLTATDDLTTGNVADLNASEADPATGNADTLNAQ